MSPPKMVTIKKKPKVKKVSQKSELKKPAENTTFQKFENRFNIKQSDVQNAVEGVIKFASNNPRLQNQLFNEEIPLYLQINSFKIPKTKGTVKQTFRVPLTHSPLPSNADICLIVPDVKGIKNDEHERHVEHYEKLLSEKNITGIKKIMTFHEFRTEYDTFELKKRLADLYDLFLVDGRISGKVVHKSGSIFYKKHKLPIAVKLHASKLKSHFESSIKKAYFHLSLSSDSHCVQFGHSKMEMNKLIENVYNVIEFLEKSFPGGIENVRNLNVYAHRGSSIPIYVCMKNPNDIKVPVLTSKKPIAYKSVSGELTTQYNADVVVRPSGQVIVKRKKIESMDMVNEEAEELNEEPKAKKIKKEKVKKVLSKKQAGIKKNVQKKKSTKSL